MARTMITAHSGCDGTRDNSAEYIRHAVTLGVDAIEVDVRRAADGRLVLAHDEDPDPYRTYEGCPGLEEAFGLIFGHRTMKINCDLKEYRLEKDVMELADKCGLPYNRVIFSGSYRPMPLYRRCSYREIEVYWNAEECIWGLYDSIPLKRELPLIAEDFCRKACEYGIGAVNIHESLVDDEVIRIAREKRVGLSVWTVDEEERLSELLAKGVMNITTRSTGLALRLRGT